MKKILITGANGYIGSAVVKKACDLFPNDEIIAIDFCNSNIDKRAKFFDIDILGQTDKMYLEIGVPDICIHLAWKDGFNHNSNAHMEFLSNHAMFVKSLIDNGCKNITTMGSMHEVGYFEGAIDEDTPCNPLSMYGIAKNALRQFALQYAQNKDVSLKWLRAFYVTGNDEKNNSIFAKIVAFEKEQKASFPFTDGKNKYDFIDICQLASQIAISAKQTDVSGIINVCSGEPVSLKDKVEEFIAKNNFMIKPEYGVFPNRQYDSPAIWGNTKKIEKIMRQQETNELNK